MMQTRTLGRLTAVIVLTMMLAFVFTLAIDAPQGGSPTASGPAASNSGLIIPAAIAGRAEYARGAYGGGTCAIDSLRPSQWAHRGSLHAPAPSAGTASSRGQFFTPLLI